MNFKTILLTASLLASSGIAAAQTSAPATGQQPAPQTTPAQPAAEPGTDQADPAAAAEQGATTSTTGTTQDSGSVTTGASAAADQVSLATAADVTAGAKVFDQAGGAVGTIESANAQGAVVSTGAARVQIPLASFGKNGSGLVLATTKADLEAAAAKATPKK